MMMSQHIAMHARFINYLWHRWNILGLDSEPLLLLLIIPLKECVSEKLGLTTCLTNCADFRYCS